MFCFSLTKIFQKDETMKKLDNDSKMLKELNQVIRKDLEIFKKCVSDKRK